MFVITKEFNGRKLSSIEHNDPKSQMRVLAGLITEISVDPRFAIRIEVKPCPVKVGDLALSPGNRQLS